MRKNKSNARRDPKSVEFEPESNSVTMHTLTVRMSDEIFEELKQYKLRASKKEKRRIPLNECVVTAIKSLIQS